MTIDIITKAGIQVGVSLSPQELAGNTVLLDFLRQLLGMQAQDAQQTKQEKKLSPAGSIKEAIEYFEKVKGRR